MFPPPPPWCHRMLTAGVTGTNGKTTTTSYLASALGCLHGRALRITTLGSFLGEEKLDVEPDYVGFVEAMKRALDVGVTMAAVECTSESLAAGFAKAWPMSIGVFTNLSRDHFDSHGSAEHYLASKAQLFVHLPAGGAAGLNAYDPASALRAGGVPPSVRGLGLQKRLISRLPALASFASSSLMPKCNPTLPRLAAELPADARARRSCHRSAS